MASHVIFHDMVIHEKVVVHDRSDHEIVVIVPVWTSVPEVVSHVLCRGLGRVGSISA